MLLLITRIRQSHHDAIWEEQKHFTWLLSIIFSAQAVVLAGTELSAPDKAIIISIASVVGILIALIGFRAQRIEGVYYHRANTHFAKEFLAVYPDAEEPHHSQAPNKAVLALIKSAITGSAGVRDYFQIIFIAFFAVFTAIAIYAYISL